MIVNFDTFKEFENPMLRLCTANNTVICPIHNPTEFTAEYSFLEYSTISFRIDYETDQECYKAARVRKEILVGKPPEETSNDLQLEGMSVNGITEDCGYFIITDIQEEKNESEQYKVITAKSCEYELSNIAMPYIGDDDGYGTYGSRVLYYEGDWSTDWSSSNENNAPSIMYQISEYLPGWKILEDHSITSVDQRYKSAVKSALETRKFETSDSTTIYGFLMDEVSEAFGCVFLFDIYNRRIYIKDKTNVISQTPIILTSDNLLESVSIKESEDDRVNCILVDGADGVNISLVNPLGNNTIFNFTEKYDSSVMSAKLWEIISEWQRSYSGYTNVEDSESDGLYVSTCKNIELLTAKISTLQTKKQELEVKKSINEKLLAEENKFDESSATIKRSDLYKHYYSALISLYNSQISAIQAIIQSTTTSLNTSRSNAQEIIDSLDFKNYILNYIAAPYVFNNLSNETQTVLRNDADSLYNELYRLIKTHSYSNDSIVLSESANSIENMSPLPSVEPFDLQSDTSNSIIDLKIGRYESAFNTWKNTKISEWATQASDKINDKFTVINRLFLDAWDILKRTSTPRREITIDSTSFIFCKEYEHLSCYLKTGCGIKIEMPQTGDLNEHYVIKISVNYSDKDFSMTLSNRYRLNDALSIFEDSYGNTSSIASITAKHTQILGDQQREINDFEMLRKQSLNYTKQKILSSDSQEIDVDDTGMTVRTVKSIDEQGNKTYDDLQFKLANGSIIFTDDGWTNAKLAIGRYYDPRFGWRMGINGEYIMANTIEASSLVVGSTHSSGTNLVMDGSFDGEMIGQLEYGGKSAWSITNGSNQNGMIRTDNLTLIYGENTESDRFEGNVPYVRLARGCSMTREIKIPKLPGTEGTEICMRMFINGRVLITLDYSGSTINFTRSFFNNSENEEDFDNYVLKSCQLLNFYISKTEEYSNLKLSISCINEDDDPIQYSSIAGIYITDNQKHIGNVEYIDDIRYYAINNCHRFTAFPNQFWGAKSIMDDSKIADNVDHLSFSGDGSYDGLRISKSGNYILYSKSDHKFNLPVLSEGSRYEFEVEVSGNNGSSMLMNSYIVPVRVVDDIAENKISDVVSGIEEMCKKSFCTFIDLHGKQECKEFQFIAEEEIRDVCIVCIMSVNVPDGESVDLRSVCIKGYGVPAKEKHLNLWQQDIRLDEEYNEYYGGSLSWYQRVNDSLAWFSYDQIQIYNDGGFDNGTYIYLMPGASITQRKRFVVYGGLPYYFSCYVKGSGTATIRFYDGNGQDASIVGSQYVYDLYNDGNDWVRVYSDTIIEAPLSARYASLTITSTIENDSNGCYVDGVMFEQSTSLNAYNSNYSESYSKYTIIDDNGLCVKNGFIKIYDSNNKLALFADESGNLALSGSVQAQSGEIGGWKIGSDSLHSKQTVNGRDDGNPVAKIDGINGYFQTMSSSSRTVVGNGALSFYSASNTNNNITDAMINYYQGSDVLQISSKKDILLASHNSDSIRIREDTIDFLKNVSGLHVVGNAFFDETIYMGDNRKPVGYAEDIYNVQANLESVVNELNTKTIPGVEQRCKNYTDRRILELYEYITESLTYSPPNTPGDDPQQNVIPSGDVTVDTTTGSVSNALDWVWLRSRMLEKARKNADNYESKHFVWENYSSKTACYDIATYALQNGGRMFTAASGSDRDPDSSEKAQFNYNTWSTEV